MKRKSQEQLVLDYWKSNEWLTSLDALKFLGIISFPKRISNLRKIGYEIEDERITVVNHYGEETSIKRYRLVKQ